MRDGNTRPRNRKAEVTSSNRKHGSNFYLSTYYCCCLQIRTKMVYHSLCCYDVIGFRLFMCKGHYEQGRDQCYILNTFIYKNFERSLQYARRRVRKEIANSFEGSAFAIVFIRAKQSGAAVLQMQFLTPDILLFDDLGPMSHGTKNYFFLVEI